MSAVLRLNMDHRVEKVFHVSSDDPAEILGLSILGAFWRATTFDVPSVGLDMCTLLWMVSITAATPVSTSSVWYEHPSIGQL